MVEKIESGDRLNEHKHKSPNSIEENSPQSVAKIIKERTT